MRSLSFDSVAAMVCYQPNEAILRQEANQQVLGLGSYEFTANMVRRVLFPKYVSEAAAARTEIESEGVDAAPVFDDRTFFQLKVSS